MGDACSKVFSGAHVKGMEGGTVLSAFEASLNLIVYEIPTLLSVVPNNHYKTQSFSMAQSHGSPGGRIFVVTLFA
jgi:hypothetical protein